MDGAGMAIAKQEVPPAAPPTEAPLGASLCDEALFCVLASSSKGNCSALILGRGASRRLYLIERPASAPRRTTALLESLGIASVPLQGSPSSRTSITTTGTQAGSPRLPERASVYMHRSHRSRAGRMGMLYLTTRLFTEDFDLVPGVRVRPALMSHDSLGAAAFRIEFEHSGRSLGFATDLGRANQKLIDHLAGVHILAIESNYCPKLQVASGRPDYLQRRIMNGSGHLSNEQAAEAVVAIGPQEHVVLLHLSQECNTPERASMYHNGNPYTVTVTSPEQPTGWIRLTWPEAAKTEVVVRGAATQASLWG